MQRPRATMCLAYFLMQQRGSHMEECEAEETAGGLAGDQGRGCREFLAKANIWDLVKCDEISDFNGHYHMPVVNEGQGNAKVRLLWAISGALSIQNA